MDAQAFGQQLADAYPGRAIRQDKSGRAVLRCVVKADGSLETCAVVSEEPKDYGFGDAALRLAKYFKMAPKTNDGASVAGAQVEFPVGFTIR